jgi:glutamate racemase
MGRITGAGRRGEMSSQENEGVAAERLSPVGIFDSGIGGLTVLKDILRELPSEDLVYFGDTAQVPYGTKSRETITRFSVDNTLFLRTFNVKMVIVACNTATSVALDTLREKFTMPIVGVIEPGARAALRCTKNGRIGVIGTSATIGSGAYEGSLKRIDPSVKVYSGCCPLFVPFVEEGWLEGDAVSQVAKSYLESLQAAKIDTLILGCTHYPLLSRVIQQTVGEHVCLVNPAEETAKEAKTILQLLGLNAPTKKKGGSLRFYVSDEPEQFRMRGEQFLGCSIRSIAKVADHFKQPEFDRRQTDGAPASGAAARFEWPGIDRRHTRGKAVSMVVDHLESTEIGRWHAHPLPGPEGCGEPALVGGNGGPAAKPRP